jgi:hypothetical protein
MVSVKELSEGRILIMGGSRYEYPDPVMDYCPIAGKPTKERSLEMVLMPGKTVEDLRVILRKYPQIRIQHIIAHEPYITEREQQLIFGHIKTIQEVAAWKRIKVEGVDYIDEFGFHVYVRSELDFFGNMSDVDLRYDNEPV